MEMTRKGAQSVSDVLAAVDALESQLQRAQPDYTLEVFGVLPNRVDGSSLNQAVRRSLEEEVDDADVFSVAIPDYNAMERAWDEQTDVFRFPEEHGLRPCQESLLDAYRDLAAIVSTERPSERRSVVNN